MEVKVNKDAYIRCPRCNEFKMRYVSRWAYFGGSIVLGLFLGFFTLFLSLLVFPVIGLICSMVIPNQYICKHCKVKLKPSEFEMLKREKQTN